MISIIIPLYNQADKIVACLKSIKEQSFNNYEIIVVNDRSTDKLSKIIKWSKKEFGIAIEWLHNKENHGAPYSRNKGLKRAKGEFLLFCDADITLWPKALDVMLKVLREAPEASYAYPSHRHGIKLFKLWPFDEEKLKSMPYIHSTALIRREHFPKDGWDINIKRLQDWDIWLTMLEEGHTGIWINKVLFKINGGGHTMSSWLPSFFYRLLPFLPKVIKYKKAVKTIKEKHKLQSYD